MPTYNQLVKLIEFLEKNPGIATGSLRTAAAKAETKRKWMMVAPSINNAGDSLKDGFGWAKYWAEKKCALKKLCAERHAFRGELYNVSELDKRMIDAIGGLKAVIGEDSMGDSLLDLPPPSPSSSDSNPLVLDTNPPSPISSCASPSSPPRESEEKYRERSPIRLPSPVRPAQILPLKKQALRCTTLTKEAVFVPAEAPPSVDSRERSPIRLHQSTKSKNRISKPKRAKTLIKKEGVMVSNEAFSELVTSVDKIATAQKTMSSALSLLAKAFLDLSKKIPEIQKD